MLDMTRSWTCCVLSVTALDNSFLNFPYYVSFGLTLTWQFLVVCVFDNNLLVSCAYSMILHVFDGSCVLCVPYLRAFLCPSLDLPRGAEHAGLNAFFRMSAF